MGKVEINKAGVKCRSYNMKYYQCHHVGSHQTSEWTPLTKPALSTLL